MRRKKKGPGSAKQRGPLKLTINNYNKTLRCVNTEAAESNVIRCEGFPDLDPLRIKVHIALKPPARRRRKQSDPDQLVWVEADEWLTELNDKAAA
jgi:hypothetical protein